jgi:hypothetical protein
MDSSRSSQAVQVRRIHAEGLHSFSGSAGRIHADTLSRPVCDEASQGSTDSAGAQAGCHGQSATKLVRTPQLQ